jgi:hypothetical protein
VVLLRAIIRSKAALAGATLFVLLFPVLLIATLFDLQGGIENPYFSLLLYLVLGPLIVIALLLIVAGLLSARARKDSGRYDYEFLKNQLTNPEHFRRFRRHAYIAAFSVSSFLFLLGLFAQTGNRYTDSVEFCGTFCHRVMTPEFITYQNSPHSRVSCVSCHIGKEVGALTGARLTGLKQLYAILSDTFPRPLQTPLENLRPSRENCEECHRPEKFHGQKLYFVDTFLPDEHNSHLQTVLIMKIGSGGYRGRSAQGIHWHISQKHQLFYAAADRERQEIGRVELIDSHGNRTTYFKNGEPQPTGGLGQLMDCIDCHNRPTHIFLSPNEALDQKLLSGQIPTGLPFIKREALAAITMAFPSAAEAFHGIADRLHQWYAAQYPELATSRHDLLAEAVRGAQQAYAENVFPAMNIDWETYPNFIGHRHGSGCFRCHDGSFKSADGKTISRSCTLCHTILAENQPVEAVLQILEGEGS